MYDGFPPTYQPFASISYHWKSARAKNHSPPNNMLPPSFNFCEMFGRQGPSVFIEYISSVYLYSTHMNRFALVFSHCLWCCTHACWDTKGWFCAHDGMVTQHHPNHLGGGGENEPTVWLLHAYYSWCSTAPQLHSFLHYFLMYVDPWPLGGGLRMLTQTWNLIMRMIMEILSFSHQKYGIHQGPQSPHCPNPLLGPCCLHRGCHSDSKWHPLSKLNLP